MSFVLTSYFHKRKNPSGNISKLSSLYFMMPRVVIVMGSPRDEEFCRRISKVLEEFKVPYEFRVASAHKWAEGVLRVASDYEGSEVVFIAVAGRSNALAGLLDAHTTKPVITCPAVSSDFWGVDIFSSLRMPSYVCPLVVLEPEAAALAAIKLLALRDSELEKKLGEFQRRLRKELEDADKRVRGVGGKR